MAKPDGVTLATPMLEDYLRRIEVICKERRNPQSVQHAMSHPGFKAAQHALMDRLAAEYIGSLPLLGRLPFLKLRVGTLKTEADFRLVLSQTDPVCNVSEWAGDIMLKKAFADSIPQEEEDVEFVYASNGELGYRGGCTRFETYEAGLKLGWKLCLASDGPEIRRHYLNQPFNDSLLLAMEPIVGSDGKLRVFRFVCDGVGVWLGSDYDSADYFWGAISRWVFRRN